MMKLCDYGCGQKAEHQLKNGKWCCSENSKSCPELIRRSSESRRGAKRSLEQIKNLSESHIGQKSSKKGKTYEEIYGLEKSKLIKESMNKDKLLTIEKIKEKYPFFSKIEETRYNPDKPAKKEIQVHCKNHECENSKEKDGWFTPSSKQIKDRKDQLENINGNGGSYFYCSQECKDSCSLYNVRGDPYKENNLPYTYAEYLTCRAVVFERENTLCEYCGEPATDMHHIFSVKLEPFFALDPDYCVACCEKHHYKYAHKDECSTGNLAKIVCSVESQKFLNQKL